MEAVKGPVEQRVLLRNVSWEAYERLIADARSARCRASSTIQGCWSS